MPRPRAAEAAWTTQAAAFERYFASRSRLHSLLSLRAATDPLVGEIVADALHIPRGNVPLRLFGAAHYLVLSGRAAAYAHADDPWPQFHAILEAHTDWLRTFVTEQPVQTNEVRRCWSLLPGLLTAIGEWDGPIDLMELGPSGGLNLLWDRHRYHYRAGSWGPEDGGLVLDGVEVTPVPEAILGARAHIRSRVGIDRHPVDVTTEHGALLLQSFVWADQPERLERLRAAIELARADPPTLVQGDYVDLVGSHLESRDTDALALVFDTHSTEYLEDGAYAMLADSITASAELGPLAWVSVELPRDEREPTGYVLEVQAWPGGERRRVADVHYHGVELAWR